MFVDVFWQDTSYWFDEVCLWCLFFDDEVKETSVHVSVRRGSSHYETKGDFSLLRRLEDKGLVDFVSCRKVKVKGLVTVVSGYRSTRGSRWVVVITNFSV